MHIHKDTDQTVVVVHTELIGQDIVEFIEFPEEFVHIGISAVVEPIITEDIIVTIAEDIDDQIITLGDLLITDIIVNYFGPGPNQFGGASCLTSCLTRGELRRD